MGDKIPESVCAAYLRSVLYKQFQPISFFRSLSHGKKETASELSVQFIILTNRCLIRIAHLPGAIQENMAFPVLWNPLFSSADAKLSAVC